MTEDAKIVPVTVDPETADVSPKKRAEKTIKCVVLRDYWDATATRVPAGTEVDLPVDAAMDGVESGSLARVKAAPK